jgi:hypothetical protein
MARFPAFDGGEAAFAEVFENAIPERPKPGAARAISSPANPPLTGDSKTSTQPSETQTPKIDWNDAAPVIAVAPPWRPAFLAKKKEEENHEEFMKRGKA